MQIRVKAEELSDELQECPATEEEYAQGNPAHVPIRVIEKLDMMFWHLVMEEDIPFLLAFLNTPGEKTERAMKAWDNYFTPKLFRRREECLLKTARKSSPYVVPQTKKTAKEK